VQDRNSIIPERPIGGLENLLVTQFNFHAQRATQNSSGTISVDGERWTTYCRTCRL